MNVILGYLQLLHLKPMMSGNLLEQLLDPLTYLSL